MSFSMLWVGSPAIERMREEYHHTYADTPSLCSVIDRIADDMRRRLLGRGLQHFASSYTSIESASTTSSRIGNCAPIVIYG
jgi:hypothetical protein